MNKEGWGGLGAPKGDGGTTCVEGHSGLRTGTTSI